MFNCQVDELLLDLDAATVSRLFPAGGRNGSAADSMLARSLSDKQLDSPAGRASRGRAGGRGAVAAAGSWAPEM